MKVGDLIRLNNAFGTLGVVVKITQRKRVLTSHFEYGVLIEGKIHPFLGTQIEVVCESR
jgi:hypothetical protein